MLAWSTGVGCGGPVAPAKSTEVPARRVRTGGTFPDYVTPAHLVAATSTELASYSRFEPDGRRLLVSHGMRIVEHPDGSFERASDLLPDRENLGVVELPERLGGGYVYFSTSTGGTVLWSAPTWTAPLDGLASFGFSVSRIVPGFDRLYLSASAQAAPVPLDLESRTVLESTGLPPAPDYQSMAFEDAWIGAIQVPYLGVLATFDAGASWHPVPEASRLTVHDSRPLLRTEDGWATLTHTGDLARWEPPRRDNDELAVLRALTNSEGEANEADEEERAKPPDLPRPLGDHPLRLAVLHGVPGPKGTAYAAYHGNLGRIRLEDGKVLEHVTARFPKDAECHGVRLQDGAGFVCSEERGATRIYALEPPLALRKVKSFAGPRYVSDGGRGGLVVRGRCDEEDAEPGYYCLLGPSGQREIRVRGDVGSERVTLLKDGMAAVLVPPRKGSLATLARVGVDGQTEKVSLKLPKKGPGAKLVREGLWLDGFFETKSGELGGWVAGAGPFVGLSIKPDGRVRIGEVQDDIERAMISGPFALLHSEYGAALETVDGGLDWREVAMLDPSKRTLAVTVEQGCSRVGCAHPQWLRVGWSGKSRDKELETVEEPERTPLPRPGGGRWAIDCWATGVVSRPALPITERNPEVAHAVARVHALAAARGAHIPPPLTSTDWQPFLEVPAPALPDKHLGFDTGADAGFDALRAYVWGQRGARWDRTGRFVVRVLDRFGVKDGVWSSELSKSPWPDELSAAGAFGQRALGGSATWQLELDVSGRRGLLLVRQASQTDLFVVEEGRSLTAIQGAQDFGIGKTSGVAKVGSSWYLGSELGSQFSVFRIVGGRLEPVLTVPNVVDRRHSKGGARLVQTADREAVAILAQSASFYFYPILGERLGAPIEIRPKEFASLPETCTGDENGFAFSQLVSVAPHVDLLGAASAVDASQVWARFIAGSEGVCVDALSATASAPLPDTVRRGTAPPSQKRAPVPMVLVEQGTSARRWAFECTL